MWFSFNTWPEYAVFLWHISNDDEGKQHRMQESLYRPSKENMDNSYLALTIMKPQALPAIAP